MGRSPSSRQFPEEGLGDDIAGLRLPGDVGTAAADGWEVHEIEVSSTVSSRHYGGTGGV